jgi:hypothetical protein
MVNFDAEDEYIVKAAKNRAEAEPLIETGYQYVAASPKGYMLFRKQN